MNYQNGYYYNPYNSNNSTPYGFNGGPYDIKDPFVNREARHLTKLSMLAGVGVLGFLFVPTVFSFLLGLAGLSDLYMVSFSFKTIYRILLSVVSIYLPFRIVYSFYSSGDKARCNEYGKPISKKAFLLAVPAGVAVCCFGDFLTAGLSGVCSSAGIAFKNYDSSLPSNSFEFFIYVLDCALIPAIVEEFAIRGVVMQPLRKYGNKFAIIMSSLIFALMHGNMQQIPFAFVAGIGLGYFAISTGSIWTGIAIHFSNNLFAVVINIITQKIPYGGFIYLYSMTVIVAVGIYCLYKYVKTEHYGLGLTVAPSSTKKKLIVSFIAFTVVSLAYSGLKINYLQVYFIVLAVLIFCYLRYKKANEKALNLPPISGLPKELMTSLYCGSPTIVAGVGLLVFLTIGSVNVTPKGIIYFFAAVAAIVGLIIKCVYSVNKSKLLEDKKPYRASIVVLVLTCMLSYFYFIAGLS